MTSNTPQNFLSWIKQKIKIDRKSEIQFYFHEREIWWASIGCNVGYEQNGKHADFERPVLVVKKFNQHVLWAIPLTSKTKRGKYYMQTKYEGATYNYILSQLRLISSKRLSRKIRMVPKNEFTEVRQRLKSFI